MEKVVLFFVEMKKKYFINRLFGRNYLEFSNLVVVGVVFILKMRVF
jgi:hypothetical protein